MCCFIQFSMEDMFYSLYFIHKTAIKQTLHTNVVRHVMNMVSYHVTRDTPGSSGLPTAKAIQYLSGKGDL